MADNKNELMKDAELDKVVGGSGIECIGLLQRLKDEGLYTPKTPLVAGNERAAANELKTYLSNLKGSNGRNLFDNPQVYSDGQANDYFHDMPLALRVPFPGATNNDILLAYIKDNV